MAISVTFVLPEFPFHPSGGPRVVFEYANGLVAKGHEATIVFRKDVPTSARTWARQIKREIRNRVVGRSVRRTLRWHALDPRVRTITTGWGADATAVASKLPDADLLVATYWTTWEVVVGAPSSKGRAVHLVQAYEAWETDPSVIDAVLTSPGPKVVVAPSLEKIMLDLGVPREQVFLVPNGLELEHFRVRTPPAQRQASVAFLVNVTPYKRFDLVVEVIEAVRAGRPDLQAIGFGVGPRPASLPDWAEYRRQPTREELAAEVLDRSAVFLCTSDHEGWGLPAAEAMACGCALVSTRNGGVQSFAAEGVSAVFADVGDGPALAAAVEELLGSPELRARISAGGVEATVGMSWQRSVDLFVQIAVDLAADREPGTS